MLALSFPYIDPVLLDLPGPFAIRWYGLMYLVGFLSGFIIFRHLAKKGVMNMDPSKVGDLLMVLAVGVFLGGRIGYGLFYQFPETLRDPLSLIRIWEGGMSFHGGLIGVLVGAWWFCRKVGMGYWDLMDGCALAIPFGITSVRFANFINGELYGRVTTEAAPFAMKFPTDPIAREKLGLDGLGMEQAEKVIQEAYQSGKWESIQSMVPWRHPSQIYQALTEGLLVGLLMWALFLFLDRKGKKMGRGFWSGCFGLGYGLCRVFMELYRQPDPQFTDASDALGVVLGPLTMGQVLSGLMIPIGLFLIFRGMKSNADPSIS